MSGTVPEARGVGPRGAVPGGLLPGTPGPGVRGRNAMHGLRVRAGGDRRRKRARGTSPLLHTVACGRAGCARIVRIPLRHGGGSPATAARGRGSLLRFALRIAKLAVESAPETPE
jgi:hypothetical protein